ncbi:hypothetical protein [Photorhabdus noenieputensis]|uniref:hypothetical protein n=1 Tax=Photorhabdus noenieputensis TaxID=1208607 RepID=UPI001FD5642E|nr:hypothetical protein [Photorhabdus noenieputensis]MCK3670392.1 hypothetical protein [Photorhabdus noenieputensis]
MTWALPTHPMIRPRLTTHGKPECTLVIYSRRDNRMEEKAAASIAPLAQSLSDLIVSFTPAQRENLIVGDHFYITQEPESFIRQVTRFIQYVYLQEVT